MKSENKQIRYIFCSAWFTQYSRINKKHSSHLMTKPTKRLCAQRRQISLGIRPVWSFFAVRTKKAWFLSYTLIAQWRLIRLGRCPGWSVLAGRSHSVGFVMRQLIYFVPRDSCSTAESTKTLLVSSPAVWTNYHKIWKLVLPVLK